nr:PREDICTED: uncharacterized protein LOC107079557 isoform X4 [Lepisosteus oculatus]XP_015220165.1 PREDICTED: uncharacterized protein LOC107079557 isoform X4 [Lepisosteus oculatus]
MAFFKIKFAAILCVAVVLQRPFSKAQDLVVADCNTEATLPCTAVQRATQYRSVHWYKVDGNRTGILRKTNNKVSLYASAKEAKLGPGEALVLPSVKPEESGIYQCSLYAVLGHRNQDSLITLKVEECVTSIMSTTVPVQQRITTVLTGEENSTELCDQVILLPSFVVVSGFTAVGLLKTALSFACVAVFLKICEKREKRMERQYWR